MEDHIRIILSIIEQPYAKKPYKDFKNYLKSAKMDNEATGLDYLIQKKFPNANKPPANQEPQNNDKKDP